MLKGQNKQEHFEMETREYVVYIYIEQKAKHWF